MLTKTYLLSACILFFIVSPFQITAGAETPLVTELIASGFDDPLLVTSPPDDYDRLFVVEQRGKIKIIKNGIVLATSFLDVTAKVSQSGNERGLLGMAFHPDFYYNGYFYVSYTRSSDGASMLERYTVSAGNPDVADPNSNIGIYGPVAQPFSNHNGGHIAFGPDGMIYFALGDGGSAGDPGCNAQNGSSLLGKILRLTDAGAVPSDNPFINNSDFLNEIWAYGLRNPWRFSFDRKTGDLWIGDVGQNDLEEIDFQPHSSTGGENYGWKVMEGTNCFSEVNCPTYTPPCNDPSLVLPVHEYPHTNGNCSVTGGYVYRGCAISGLQGAYFFADFCTAKCWTFRYDGNQVSDFEDRTVELDPPGPTSIEFISSFGEDASGELYIVERNGEIFKIVPDAPSAFQDLGFGKPGTGGVQPILEVYGQTGTGDMPCLRLRKAAPSSTALLIFSLAQNPVSKFGGTIVPDFQTGIMALLTTNDKGNLFFEFPGGGGPADVFVQYLVSDPGATNGVSFSNAIHLMMDA